MFSTPAACVDGYGSASSRMELQRARDDEDASLRNFADLSLGRSPEFLLRHDRSSSDIFTTSRIEELRRLLHDQEQEGSTRRNFADLSLGPSPEFCCSDATVTSPPTSRIDDLLRLLHDQEGSIRNTGDLYRFPTALRGPLGFRITSPTGYPLLRDPGPGRPHVCSDRAAPAPRQDRQPEVRVPPAASEAIPRPAAAEDAMPSPWGREVVGVYKDGRLLYVTFRGSVISSHAHDPGVRVIPLSTGLGTLRTPDGVDIDDFLRPRRTRSVPGGCCAEGASRRDVRRRGLQHEPSGVQHPQEGDAAASDLGKGVLMQIERIFFDLIHSGDSALESELVGLLSTLSDNDTQAFEDINLSEPSSESDHLADDPEYEADEEADGATDGEYFGGSGSGDDDNDEEEDDDEEENEEEEDPTYVPDLEEEDDDNDYMAALAAVPPLPDGAYTLRGITYVTNIRALSGLVPEVHIIGFDPVLSLHKRIRLWARADTRGFDFQPTEMLRYVWRMELLLSGENPGNHNQSVNEPPVPNPGDYLEEGWSTDEDLVGDMEID